MTGTLPNTFLKAFHGIFDPNTTEEFGKNQHFHLQKFPSLTETYFYNCLFTNCSFSESTLSECSFVNCTFRDCTFRETTFHKTIIQNSLFNPCHFSRITLYRTPLFPDREETQNAFYFCRGIATIHGVGLYSRTILAYHSSKGFLAQLGCFTGTQEEALYEVRYKYSRDIENGARLLPAYEAAISAIFAIVISNS